MSVSEEWRTQINQQINVLARTRIAQVSGLSTGNLDDHLNL